MLLGFQADSQLHKSEIQPVACIIYRFSNMGWHLRFGSGRRSDLIEEDFYVSR